jgi:hypothetical protein
MVNDCAGDTPARFTTSTSGKRSEARSQIWEKYDLEKHHCVDGSL